MVTDERKLGKRAADENKKKKTGEGQFVRKVTDAAVTENKRKETQSLVNIYVNIHIYTFL